MEERENHPWILAHRGDVESGPENTLTALDGAVKKGADGVEIDIRMTKDGQIVVFHDEDLARMIPEAGTLKKGEGGTRIVDMTWEELNKQRIAFRGHILGAFPEGGYRDERECILPENMVGYDDPRAEKILLFDEFLSWIMNQRPGFLAEVEYKASGMMPELISLIEAHGAAKRCILFSGEESYNREIQEWCQKNGKPEGLRLGANIRLLNEKTLSEIKDYDLWEVGLNAWAFGKEEVKRLEEEGIRVFSNLGDVPEWWKQMDQVNVTAFKTNCTGPYLKWRMERQNV